MAIEFIEGPKTSTGAGVFTLPPEFDTKKYVSQWTKKGTATEAACQRQPIVGTRMSADAWAIWKNPETKKPHSVTISTGEHILLFRPREIQQAVNAIYGNIGKERQLAEKRGETMGGVAINDPGLLSDERIAKVTGSREPDGGEVIMNKVDNVQRVSTKVIELNSEV